MPMLVLSKVNILSEKVDTHCPLCLFICRDKTDFDRIQTDGACTECYINFRHVMGADWDNGKRPSVLEARRKMGFESHI